MKYLKKTILITFISAITSSIHGATVTRSYSVTSPFQNELLTPINSEPNPQLGTSISMDTSYGFDVNVNMTSVRDLGGWNLSDRNFQANRNSLKNGVTGQVADCGNALGEPGNGAESDYWFQTSTSNGQTNSSFTKPSKNIFCRMIQEGNPAIGNNDIVAMIPVGLVFNITNYIGPDVRIVASTTGYNNCIANLDGSSNPRDVMGSCPMVLNGDGSFATANGDNGVALNMDMGSVSYILQKPIFFPVDNNGPSSDSFFDKMGSSVMSENGIDYEILMEVDNLNYYY